MLSSVYAAVQSLKQLIGNLPAIATVENLVHVTNFLLSICRKIRIDPSLLYFFFQPSRTPDGRAEFDLFQATYSLRLARHCRSVGRYMPRLARGCAVPEHAAGALRCRGYYCTSTAPGRCHMPRSERSVPCAHAGSAVCGAAVVFSGGRERA